VDAHKDAVQKLVNPDRGRHARRLYAAVGKAAYAQALDNEKGIFNPTGIMPADGPKTCLSVLSAFNPAVKGKSIDLAKRCTDEFVKASTPVS
jgi:NitT/TauT family transport system substrate-binding protein